MISITCSIIFYPRFYRGFLIGANHAWIKAWIPRYGWAGIYPTNKVWVTNTHVKLAVGRNFSHCSLIKGTFAPGEESSIVATPFTFAP